MIAFLTSSPGGSYKIDDRRIACGLCEDNSFVVNLAKCWKNDAKVLIISSDPTKYEMNDSVKNIFEQSFPLSGLSVQKMDLWDDRATEMTADNILQYDVIILAGGHVPTQNRFFERVGLAREIHQFHGILIGISAGTMNCASTVYAQPELDGEAVDPDYKRFLKGLGLTDLMILPHYQYIKDLTVDGLRTIEDMAYADSTGRSFLCLCDGSYVLIENGQTTVYGEAYLVEDGSIRRI